MKTAVIYARYSSDKQTEQSIEGQLRICKDYADRNDILVLDTYVDRAISGRTDNRASFQKMLKESANKTWDYVLVYKLDRFSRNKYEMAIHRKALRDNGVKLLSAMENIPDSPEGIILESLLEGMAEYYSAELAQKVSRGMRESWIKGNATGGGHCYGYDIINKKYVINETESKAVKFMFEKYAEGATAKDIAASLNEQGYRKTNNQPFEQKYILDLLHKLYYTGKAYRQGELYENIYPPIISEELYERVNIRFEYQKHTKGRITKNSNYILTDKLICGNCKSTMFGDAGTSASKGIVHRYYSCSTKHLGAKKRKCTLKSVKKDYLENLIFTHIMQIVNTPDQLDYIADKVSNQILKSNDNTKEALIKKQIKDNQKNLKNLLNAIEQGIVTDTTKQRLEDLEELNKKLEHELAKELQKHKHSIGKEQIIKFLKTMANPDKADDEFKRFLIDTFVKNIIVFPEKIIIVYNSNKSDDYSSLDKQSIKQIEKLSDNTLKKQQSVVFSNENKSSTSTNNGLP